MKSEVERSLRKPGFIASSEIKKIPPVHKIPKKPRNPKEARERKRVFSTISRTQLEGAKARSVEEAAARELLRSKNIQPPIKSTGAGPNPAAGSGIENFTKVIPTLSVQDLTKVAETIKRRRRQLIVPIRPEEDVTTRLRSPEVKQPESELAPAGTAEVPRPRVDTVPTPADAVELEERLLHQLLECRAHRPFKKDETKEVKLQVPQLADTLVSRSLRHDEDKKVIATKYLIYDQFFHLPNNYF